MENIPNNSNSHLPILHQDLDQVVVNKPYGLLSIPGVNQPDCVESRLRALGFLKARAVHRLDMLTTGIILCSIRGKAESELMRQFRERLVEKEYVAWVTGNWQSESGVIDLPLAQNGKDPITGYPRHQVDFTIGKKAVTHYKVIRRIKDATLLHLFPKTGRSHQLRVHCASQGHPIVGDPIYGTIKKSQMYLHACYLK